MDEFIKTFHVDWKLLVAQLVNFGIVLFVVWRFALKPLMKTMAARTKDIEKSLDDAKRIEAELAATERMKQEHLLKAKKEAQAIIEQAAQEAEKIRTDKVEQTKREMEEVVVRTKQQIVAEKDQMMADVRTEVGGLVIAASEKVIAEKLDSESDHKLVERAVHSLKSK